MKHGTWRICDDPTCHVCEHRPTLTRGDRALLMTVYTASALLVIALVVMGYAIWLAES